MLKIVVGGALSKKEIADCIEECANGKAEVTVLGDLQAAIGLKSGAYDYYFGACQTGAGGALGMAIAMVGMDKCISVAMVGKVLGDDEIIRQINQGKIAFGFVKEAALHVIPVIMKELLKEE